MNILIFLFIILLVIDEGEEKYFFSVNENVFYVSSENIDRCLADVRIVKKVNYDNGESKEKYGSCFSTGITVIQTSPVIKKQTLFDCLGPAYKLGDGKNVYVLNGEILYKSNALNEIDSNKIKSIIELGQLTSCEKYKLKGINGVIEVVTK